MRGAAPSTPVAWALQHYWLRILLGGCACAIGAFTVSLFLPKIFRATTYLLVSESKMGESSRDTNLQQMAMLATFIPFVDNDALIDESLKKLQMDRAPYGLTTDLFRRQGYMDVRAEKSTRLLELTIEFPDARLSAALANELAQGAVRFNDRLNASDDEATQDFLKRQLDASRAQQQESAARRLKILKEAQIEDREKDLAILLTEKDRLSAQLQQLRLDLVQNQSRAQALEKALTREPELISLKKSISSDRFVDTAIAKVFSDETPLSMTEESVNETREEIRRTLVSATTNVAAQSAGIQAASERLAQLNREIPVSIGSITSRRSMIDTATQDYLLSVEATKNASHGFQTASVTVRAKSQNIKQIAPALVPERPVRPNLLLDTLLGFLTGVLLFSFAVIVCHSLAKASFRIAPEGETTSATRTALGRR